VDVGFCGGGGEGVGDGGAGGEEGGEHRDGGVDLWVTLREGEREEEGKNTKERKKRKVDVPALLPSHSSRQSLPRFPTAQ
jgi:hypothetical protein